MGWRRQGFINILAERVENDKDLYTFSRNGLKTTRIYTDSRRMGWKRQGFIEILALASSAFHRKM
jgi:hypothetical protein